MFLTHSQGRVLDAYLICYLRSFRQEDKYSKYLIKEQDMTRVLLRSIGLGYRQPGGFRKGDC